MAIAVAPLRDWLQTSRLGQYLSKQESVFFQTIIQQNLSESLLCIGNLPWTNPPDSARLCIQQSAVLPADILVKSEQMPWREHSFDCVISAHESDCCDDPMAFLCESFRIVKPHGILVLTGFNPYSLWRWGKSVPNIRHCPTLAQMKIWFAEIGWKMEEGRFINYLPPIAHLSAPERWHFLELAGNRWFPHTAAVYALVLRKTVTGGITPTPNLHTVDLEWEQDLALAKEKA